ncbi:MAG: hypothetical protein NBKEAIPA_03157 [Nitrospirae bacterium]|nr:MAG: hypothetical protein UZ03_NOB001003008 [Nitrospira sp. OLB3]MBV6471225.1 hypothetical protein [Nitrospirota bacterium]MCE7966293.1 DUF2231 domain-containing protein [Nitrospira sp. NTP2]MCK6491950.1 DUF2231 domain-containing protein [Nitrospira sp.]MEB2339745.1 DUF2231 domain-containing protein [Nitrospirales bacterium]
MHPLHPMFVHFPVALLSASVLFDLLAEKWRPEELRIASFYTLLLGLAGAVVTVATGAMAEESVEQSGVPKRVLEIHEALGFTTFWIFAGLVGVRAATWLGWIRDRRFMLVLGLVGVAVLFVTSYFGGSLVYDFGAGVAARR